MTNISARQSPKSHKISLNSNICTWPLHSVFVWLTDTSNQLLLTWRTKMIPISQRNNWNPDDKISHLKTLVSPERGYYCQVEGCLGHKDSSCINLGPVRINHNMPQNPSSKTKVPSCYTSSSWCSIAKQFCFVSDTFCFVWDVISTK